MKFKAKIIGGKILLTRSYEDQMINSSLTSQFLIAQYKEAISLNY